MFNKKSTMIANVVVVVMVVAMFALMFFEEAEQYYVITHNKQSLHTYDYEELDYCVYFTPDRGNNIQSKEIKICGNYYITPKNGAELKGTE